MLKSNNFSLIELMKTQRESRKNSRAEAREAGMTASQMDASSQLMLTAQTSRVNSQISTPRLTPLRMIERNRNTDKEDINRLESKIKALETQITEAKQVGEDRKLDRLERSLTNIPRLTDSSLLEETP